MTKAEIIEDIVQKTGIARKDVATTVEAFMESVKDCMLEKKRKCLFAWLRYVCCEASCRKDSPQH